MHVFGRALMIAGAVLLLAGAWLYWSKDLGGLGRLPGDILMRKENFTFYFPLGTSLLLSAVLSLLLYLLNKK